MSEKKDEQLYCSCGITVADEVEQTVHQSKQKNKFNHTLVKERPNVCPKMMMFDIWAVDRKVSSEAADLLIHASLHVHLTEVIVYHLELIERLLDRREYEKRALLEAAFPCLLFAQSKSKTMMNRAQLLHVLTIEDYFDGTADEDLIEVVVEWERRHREL